MEWMQAVGQPAAHDLSTELSVKEQLRREELELWETLLVPIVRGSTAGPPVEYCGAGGSAVVVSQGDVVYKMMPAGKGSGDPLQSSEIVHLTRVASSGGSKHVLPMHVAAVQEYIPGLNVVSCRYSDGRQEKIPVLGSSDASVGNEKKMDGWLRPRVFIGMPKWGHSLRAELTKGTQLYKPHNVARVILQSADALAGLHKLGLVHRDIKPENILVKYGSDGRPEIRVADLGISAVEYTEGGSGQVDAGGPYMYCPREQHEGLATRRSDEYALAAVAYELITGQPPFMGNDRELKEAHYTEQPPSFAEITGNPYALPAWEVHAEGVIKRALSKDPDERYPSVTEFAEALCLAIYEGSPADQREMMRADLPEATVNLLRAHDVLEEAEGAHLAANQLRADAPVGETEQDRTSRLTCAGINYEKARRLYCKALSMDPGNINAYYELAVMLQSQGRRDYALTLLDALCKQRERQASDFVATGFAHTSHGRHVEAISKFARAEKLGYGDKRTLCQYMAQTFEALGNQASEQNDMRNARIAYADACAQYSALHRLCGADSEACSVVRQEYERVLRKKHNITPINMTLPVGAVPQYVR